MSRKNIKTLKRLQVGGIPLIRIMAERIGLKEILLEHVQTRGKKDMSTVESLMLLLFNLTIGKEPLYELENWLSSIDSRSAGYSHLLRGRFTDDRFGRALDKLYLVDRASLMTHLVVALVKNFNIDMQRIHNDSTSVKAFGRISGKTKTGFELRYGHSKDHRPDLKQLVFNLSISSDGAVPIHHKTYSGNRNDDTTHIETWDTIRSIVGSSDFLYVADSKLCGDQQLNHIVQQGGQAVTIMPNYRLEIMSFKEELRQERKPKKEIWRKLKPGSQIVSEYFSVFEGNYYTKKRGYRIHWIHSSEKRKRDRLSKEDRMKKVERNLAELSLKLNKRKLKTKKDIRIAALKVLREQKCERLFCLETRETRARYRIKVRLKPQGYKYKIRDQVIFKLSWSRNIDVLKIEERLDGIFPLLCTDTTLSTKEVLQAYKYQPNLEKRFSQFKGIHYGAPLLFKKIERVEANMFAFFIALILQSLLEREIRQRMQKEKIACLKVYPEDRDATHPTTSKVLKIFEKISTYKIMKGTKVIEEYRDELNITQKTILELLDIPEEKYWIAD